MLEEDRLAFLSSSQISDLSEGSELKEKRTETHSASSNINNCINKLLIQIWPLLPIWQSKIIAEVGIIQISSMNK